MRLIDADAVHATITQVFYNGHDDPNAKLFGYLIDEAPTIETIKYGKWEFDHMTGERSYYARCSSCRKILRFFKDKSEEFNYCPDCGATMDLEG